MNYDKARAHILFNNDSPLVVLVDPTPEQLINVKAEYTMAERERAQQSYGLVRTGQRDEVEDHMRRCYFHYHDVPLAQLAKGVQL